MLAHETIRKFAEEIVMNHELDGMEAVLYTNGDYSTRQTVTRYREGDNRIMVKVPLGEAYWRDTQLWGEDLDDLIQWEHIMDSLIEEIYFRIEEWKYQQAELKKESHT